MSNLQLLIDNLHDQATVDVIPAAALPVINTQDQRRDYVWESADLSDQTITGTLNSANVANVLCLSRHNLSAAATVRVVLKKDGLEVYDSLPVSVAEIIPAGVWRAGIDGWMATYNDLMPAQMAVISFPSKTFDEYVITISDSTNLDGFIHLARIAIGQTYTANVNFSYGAKFDWVESAKHSRMSGGGLYTSGDSGSRARRMTLNLDWLTKSDRIALEMELSRVGQGQDILLLAYPESGGVHELLHSFMAKRVSGLGFTHAFHNNFKTSLTFEEC